MKERPILFTGESVRATLDNREWVTRRVIKPQPTDCGVHCDEGKTLWGWYPNVRYRGNSWCEGQNPVKYIGEWCPYGKPGDRLWVRETWAVDCHLDHLKPSQIPQESHVFYRENDWSWDNVWGTDQGEIWDKWRPSIFMPRWASRLTLEVTGVRVERVQQATLEDMIAEGCPAEYLPENCNGMSHAVYGWFEHLWDSINLKRGYPWKLNPWVWVVEFKRVS